MQHHPAAAGCGLIALFPAKDKPSPQIPECAPSTPLDAFFRRQCGRLDEIGDLARTLRPVAGLTPARLRRHLIKTKCTLATWRACNAALAEFAALRRSLPHIGGRRNG